MKTKNCSDAIMEEQVEDSAQNTKRQSMENGNNAHKSKENISDFVSSTQQNNLDEMGANRGGGPNMSHSQSNLSTQNQKKQQPNKPQ